MRIALAVAALMAALATPASARDNQIWFFLKSGDREQLIHGVPESHALSIAFVCEPKARRIALVSPVVPRKPAKGQGVTLTLSNGVAKAAYAGTTSHDSENGFQYEGKTAAEPKVMDVLRKGKSLSIGASGRQRRVPLRGVEKPLKEFEAACFRS